MDVIDMIEIKPYLAKDLSVIYGVCPKTFSKWIKPFRQDIGMKRGRYYSVMQVKMIVEKIGMPYKMIA